jgi:hypothetical protein
VEELAAIFPLVHLLQPYMVEIAVFEEKTGIKKIINI